MRVWVCGNCSFSSPFVLLSVPEEYGVTNNRCTRKKQTTERQETERISLFCPSRMDVALSYLLITLPCRHLSSVFPYVPHKQTNKQTNLAKQEATLTRVRYVLMCVCVYVCVCVRVRVCALIHKNIPLDLPSTIVDQTPPLLTKLPSSSSSSI